MSTGATTSDETGDPATGTASVDDGGGETSTGSTGPASSDSSGTGDGGKDGPVVPAGDCPDGAVCGIDSDGDAAADHCIWACDTEADCPFAGRIGCYNCEMTVIGRMCVPDQLGFDGECNFGPSTTDAGGNLLPGALCLPGECNGELAGSGDDMCIPLDDVGLTTAGYCAPPCTP